MFNGILCWFVIVRYGNAGATNCASIRLTVLVEQYTFPELVLDICCCLNVGSRSRDRDVARGTFAIALALPLPMMPELVERYTLPELLLDI